MQVHSTLKTTQNRTSKKVYGMLTFIIWTSECQSWEDVLQLYKTLENCVHFCLPCHRKDMEALERIAKEVYQDIVEIWDVFGLKRVLRAIHQ